MDSKELRIGNYVWDGYSGVMIISQITYSTESVYFRKTWLLPEGFARCQDIEPIPLTKERVEEFGFEGKINEISNCGNFYLDYDAEYGRHGMSLWYQKGAWCFSHTETFTVLKYVHQLQNLYYALTGKELVINNLK
jgi:hypothetical protein